MTVPASQPSASSARSLSIRNLLPAPAMRSTCACASSPARKSPSSPTRRLGKSRPASSTNWRRWARPTTHWILEDLAPRPLTDLPREIVDDLETSQVSIFAVQAQANELRSRMQMTDVVNRRKIRHAHMVNINQQIMLEGMRADFLKVDRISTKVVEMVRRASRFAPRHPPAPILPRPTEPGLQLAEDQRHHQPGQVGQSCPAAKSLPLPARSTGRFVIDGVVGD